MRIVTGEFKGRAIRTPEGEDTRPTSDRARQAVFNILEHAPWSDGVTDKRVIDLFAGSGAMGLEALSRGASACWFVETAAPALAAIGANIDAYALAARTRVLRQNATRLPPRPESEPGFDLAFLDPPYGAGLGEAALAALVAGAWLAEGAVIVFERGADEPEPATPGFGVLDERRYGAARVWMLRA